jgi:hypothetical protein
MTVMLLALFAQASLAAPVQMRRPPPHPPGQTVAPPMNTSVKLLPDIVIKEIRKDGPNGVRALVANEGSADESKPFSVVAWAQYRSRHGSSMPRYAGPLKVGQSEWVRFEGFVPDGESWYPGKPQTTLADWETISVSADGYQAPPPWSSGLPPGFDPTKKPECTPTYGCVVELDEHNNTLSAPIASMADWTGS